VNSGDTISYIIFKQEMVIFVQANIISYNFNESKIPEHKHGVRIKKLNW